MGKIRHNPPDPIVYLGLGANLGDRLANLQRAIQALPPAVKVVRASSIYETEPWGYHDQPAFLNQVLEGSTDLSPGDLLQHLKGIERELGRQPTFRYGPRLVDLDILLYGDQVVDLPELAIPHPRLAERAFVLVPLAELAPDLRHPASRQTVRAMLSQLDTAGVRKFSSVAGENPGS